MYNGDNSACGAGTCLCILDRGPRQLTPQELAGTLDFVALAGAQLECELDRMKQLTRAAGARLKAREA